MCSALLVKYTGFCNPDSSRTKTELTANGDTARYKYRISLSSGELKSGGLARYSCNWPKASSHSLLQTNVFRRILKKGKHLSFDQEMNRFKAAILPVNCCSCFVVRGACISSTAQIFSGFASIPLLETMNPRNFPDETPKAHFAGFNFI